MFLLWLPGSGFRSSHVTRPLWPSRLSLCFLSAAHAFPNPPACCAVILAAGPSCVNGLQIAAGFNYAILPLSSLSPYPGAIYLPLTPVHPRLHTHTHTHTRAYISLSHSLSHHLSLTLSLSLSLSHTHTHTLAPFHTRLPIHTHTSSVKESLSMATVN